MLALPLTVERNMLDMGSLLVLSTAIVFKVGAQPGHERFASRALVNVAHTA